MTTKTPDEEWANLQDAKIADLEAQLIREQRRQNCTVFDGRVSEDTECDHVELACWHHLLETERVQVKALTKERDRLGSCHDCAEAVASAFVSGQADWNNEALSDLQDQLDAKDKALREILGHCNLWHFRCPDLKCPVRRARGKEVEG